MRAEDTRVGRACKAGARVHESAPRMAPRGRVDDVTFTTTGVPIRLGTGKYAKGPGHTKQQV